ncbi:MAG: RHS repeat-associated core domain-containing protein, partial [Candidatus Electrothrix sp. ATG2]|nr:RHS repeat-associated core domain-containing protein [Candidatus Electrothrix sp. ATG2]
AEYLPFGNVNISVAQIENNLRFPGQYFDAETGLHYNWNRYYDPETGRYIAADPIGLDGGINLYAYVGSDPVNKVDLAGLVEGDMPSQYPPGHGSDWIDHGDGTYTDPNGNYWRPHPEDKGHWPHWDEQKPNGEKKRHPQKSKKPWPGQKKPPYGDQSAEDPNKEIPECDSGCKMTIIMGMIIYTLYNVCTGAAGG